MVWHYIRIALKNAASRKAYSIINVLGLAVGMACCILILTYIVSELGYDRYHSKSSQIYRLCSNLTLGGTPNAIASSNAPPSLVMANEFPEVLNAVRLRSMPTAPVRYEDRQFYEERILYADNSIFELFDFPLVEGSNLSALETAWSIVISESMAEKYFGGENPLGKTLRINTTDDYVITGVVRDVPKNSHFVFDMLVSIETLYVQNRDLMDSWLSPFNHYSYILLREGTDFREIEERFPAMIEKYVGQGLRDAGIGLEYFLQPLTRIHLYSNLRHELAPNSDASYIYIFGFIALAILAIASFNFVNLTTARASIRSKEVGVRKVMGANRKELIKQFLIESMLYSLASLALGLVLAYLAIPYFGEILAADSVAKAEGISSMSVRSLSMEYSDMPWLVPSLICLAVFIGIVAGSYPAFYLASLDAAKSIRGGFSGNTGSAWFRRVLVTLQFAISILLMIASVIVFNQLNHLREIRLGFDKENIVVLPVMDDRIRSSMESIKQELLAYEGIVSAGASTHVLGRRPSGGSYHPKGYPAGETEMMNFMGIDEDLVDTLGMNIVQGRNLSRNFPGDATGSVLINESAARKFGWDEPIGKTVRNASAEQARVVVGVVDDFYFSSPHVAVSPMYISPAADMVRYLYIRIRPGDIPGTLAFLRQKWLEFDPDRPFDYFFLDRSYDGQFLAEQNLSKLFSVFSGLAIFVACLGLYGMAAFTTERRTKEIGIRKVFGSSVPGIVMLLSRELIALSVVANLIAWPLAYIMMNKWLESFPFRTDINAGLFLGAGLVMLLIGFVTVSYWSIRAGLASPARSLRYE
jgi:putative ABC transport system permease protein